MTGAKTTLNDVRVALMRDSFLGEKKHIDNLKQYAIQWMPPAKDEEDGYSKTINKIRRAYSGDLIGDLKAKLQKRFKSSWENMDPVTFNFVRFVAATDAAVYDEQPTREIYIGDEDAPDNVRELFATAIAESNAIGITGEMERRLKAAKTVFGRVRWDDDEKALKVRIYWPDDVLVVPDYRKPESIQDALALLVKISSSEGATGDPDWEIWWKRKEGERWRVQHVTADAKPRGTSIPVVSEVAGDVLPWFVLHDEDPDGLPYCKPDTLLLAFQESVGADWTNLGTIIDHQAHNELAWSGPAPKDPIVRGPDRVLSFPEGGVLQLLNYSPQIDQVLDTIDQKARVLATTRRQSADAYVAQSGNQPESGVALKIRNAPQEKARKESEKRIKDFEETQMLPVMAAVAATWGEGMASLYGENVTYKFTPGTRDESMSKAEQTEVLKAQVDAGIITKAQMAYQLRPDLYDSLQDAEDAVAQIGAASQAAQPARVGFADRVRQRTQTPPPPANEGA